MVPGFSKGDKVALHGWVPLNPAALQGLFPAAKVLLVKQKNPSSAAASHAERSCSLPVWFDQFS